MKNHTLSMLQEDLSHFSKEELSRSAPWKHRTTRIFAQRFCAKHNGKEPSALRHLTKNLTWGRTGQSASTSQLMFDIKHVSWLIVTDGVYFHARVLSDPDGAEKMHRLKELEYVRLRKHQRWTGEFWIPKNWAPSPWHVFFSQPSWPQRLHIFSYFILPNKII